MMAVLIFRRATMGHWHSWIAIVNGFVGVCHKIMQTMKACELQQVINLRANLLYTHLT